MEEKNKKYDELLEKAQLIKSVGQKFNGLIEDNNYSIDYYNKEIERKLSSNQEADISWMRYNIEILEKENKLIAEVETNFWKTHVF